MGGADNCLSFDMSAGDPTPHENIRIEEPQQRSPKSPSLSVVENLPRSVAARQRWRLCLQIAWHEDCKPMKQAERSAGPTVTANMLAGVVDMLSENFSLYDFCTVRTC